MLLALEAIRSADPAVVFSSVPKTGKVPILLSLQHVRTAGLPELSIPYIQQAVYIQGLPINCLEKNLTRLTVRHSELPEPDGRWRQS